MGIIFAIVLLLLVIAAIVLVATQVVAHAMADLLDRQAASVALQLAALQQAIADAQRATSEAQGAVVTELLGKVLAVLAPADATHDAEPNEAEQVTIPDPVLRASANDLDTRDWTDDIISTDGWDGSGVALLAPGEGPLDYIFNRPTIG